jgi:hypothetical protein
MNESSTLADSLSMVVTRADGTIKDTRFVKQRFGYKWEFLPNQTYLSLINQGRIQPNTWKVPFLFGTWKATKE